MGIYDNICSHCGRQIYLAGRPESERWLHLMGNPRCEDARLTHYLDTTAEPRQPITPRELGDAMRGEFSPSASSVKGPER